MAKTHDSDRKLWLYAAALLIPCALLLGCFALLGIAPFGDKTVLLYDSSYQYQDFAAYLKTIFTGENDLLYTFSKNLGGEMVSLLTYYLLSPFSLLFGFASKQSLPLVYTAVVVLKMSACGLTFFYAIGKQYGVKRSNLIFSTAYALMAYNTLYGWNIMWLDGVLILPLLGLGLKNLWNGKSARLYAVSLAYGLLTNFYIGYMLCIASVLFSLAHAVSTDAPISSKCRRFGKFVFASCVGGFTTAFAWLPTFFSLLGGRASEAGSAIVWVRCFNILGLAGKVVAGSATADQITLGTPHVFCGIFTVLLAVVFFLYGKNKLRSRLAALGVIAVLLVSFSIRGLDIIWHGFSPNNAFNYRYAFLFSYVLLMLARHTWQQRTQIPRRCFLLAGALLLAMIVGLVGMKQLMDLDFISLAGLAVSAVVLLATTVYLVKGEMLRRFGCGLFALVCLFELGANYYLSMDAVTDTATLLRLSEYEACIQQVEPAVDAVKTLDPGFYRMEKTFQRSQNDAMLFDYNGLTHFSSSQSKSVTRFMKKMGMTSYGDVWSQYGSGVTGAVDALLGVKYVLSETDLAASKDYVLRDTVNGIGIYENPNALSMAMLSSPAIRETNMGQEDYFVLQNQIWSGITGGEKQLLLSAEGWQLTLENLTETENGDDTRTYSKEDSAASAALTWEIPVTQAMPLYFYFSAPAVQSADVYVNGEYAGSYFGEYRWDIAYAGTYAVGDTVTVTLVPDGNSLTMGNAYFYYEDLTAVSQTAQAVKASPVSLEENTSSHLSGSFTAEEGQLLLFTIPYDAGWKLTVDGKSVECTQVMDVFLAAEVAAGAHTYELRFTPSGSIQGCAFTIAALLAAAIWTLAKKKKSVR